VTLALAQIDDGRLIEQRAVFRRRGDWGTLDVAPVQARLFLVFSCNSVLTCCSVVRRKAGVHEQIQVPDIRTRTASDPIGPSVLQELGRRQIGFLNSPAPIEADIRNGANRKDRQTAE